MNMNAKRRPRLILLLSAMTLPVLASWGSPALADGPAPIAKGPEVTTVGTGPYLGPLPEELAKLAEQEATTSTSPPPAKEPDTATITTGGGNLLTESELTKLAALLAIPVSVPEPFMPKLEPMQVSKEGIPLLTAKEREKHASELATPHVITPVSPAAQVRSGDSPGETGSTAGKTEKLKGNVAPAVPPPAPRSGR